LLWAEVPPGTGDGRKECSQGADPCAAEAGDDHIVLEYDVSGTFDGSPFSAMAWM
jgi:hypothetical protein